MDRWRAETQPDATSVPSSGELRRRLVAALDEIERLKTAFVPRPLPTAAELDARVLGLLARVERDGWPVVEASHPDASASALALVLGGRCPFCGGAMNAPHIGAESGLTWHCPQDCRP
jgi:hypothetical protein